MPSAKPGGEPVPEALLWLLLTGEMPTQAQTAAVTAELHSRSHVPATVEHIIKHFPKGMHPMTQLASAVLALQPHSKFAAAYSNGVAKSKYWESAFEDIMDLIAKLPTVAALIYRNSYHAGGNGLAAAYNPQLDYSANFARMLGFTDPQFDELMRLYLVIHADHEGGNVSAHTTRLVGSALSDPYLSFSAAMCGLAGPLHGLANQEVLGWILDLQAEFAKVRARACALLLMPLCGLWRASVVIVMVMMTVFQRDTGRYSCGMDDECVSPVLLRVTRACVIIRHRFRYCYYCDKCTDMVSRATLRLALSTSCGEFALCGH